MYGVGTDFIVSALSLTVLLNIFTNFTILTVTGALPKVPVISKQEPSDFHFIIREFISFFCRIAFSRASMLNKCVESCHPCLFLV